MLGQKPRRIEYMGFRAMHEYSFLFFKKSSEVGIFM